jgi:hypothetical protein
MKAYRPAAERRALGIDGAEEDKPMSSERIFDPDPPPRSAAEKLLRSGDVDSICGTLALLARPYAEVHIGRDCAWLGIECPGLLKDGRPAVRASAAQCSGATRHDEAWRFGALCLANAA